MLRECQKRYVEAKLLDLGATGVGRFRGPILMVGHVLVGVERTAPRGIENFGIRSQRITGRRSGKGESVTVLIAASECAGNQIGSLRSGSPTSGRPQLVESRSKAPELGHVLGLHGVDGLQFTNDRH